jgi:hypothetical protein
MIDLEKAIVVSIVSIAVIAILYWLSRPSKWKDGCG